jgi:hypothetical protein
MRYAIRNAAGLFFSGNEVPETVYEPTPGNPTVAVARARLAPQFLAVVPFGAVKYETAGDAASMLTHADLKDPTAFAGCQVCEIEFDRQDPNQARPV